jgi:hypothetical protein
MREEKKPKGFQPGSRKGRRMQCISDAIREMEEQGAAYVRHYFQDGQRHRARIIPVPENIDLSGRDALLRGRGGFRFATLTTKDGLKAQTFSDKDMGSSRLFHVDPADIAALVEAWYK